MYGKLQQQLQQELSSIRERGLYKTERIITSPQGASITVTGRETPVLNFCANNYLGLSSHPSVIEAAKQYLDSHGFGMSSVRFICGTQDIHKELEAKIAAFCHTDDTILYAACFDANGGVFEPLFEEMDAIISDSLNHASIIDGVRLCKAKRYRYPSCDMQALEQQLQQAKTDGARNMIIVTDAVFSMDGTIAPLDKICDLADRYEALVMVDECHSMGFMGAHAVASLSTAVLPAVSLSSREHSGRLLVAVSVDLQPAGRRSLRCCVNVRGRIYSQIPCRPPLSVPALP